MLTQDSLFSNIDTFLWKDIFCEKLDGYDDVQYVWDVLKRIKGYVENNVRHAIEGTVEEGAFVEENVYIGEGTVVERGALVKGPSIIGRNCHIRHGAYIRGYALICDNCVVGHATEVIRALFLPGAKAPHFNYVGDSILGTDVNLGAGTKLSNLKNTSTGIVIKYNGRNFQTGLRKFGAILGDRCQTGCNSVLNPGTILGPDCIVYATASVRGVYTGKTIIKVKQNVETSEFRF